MIYSHNHFGAVLKNGTSFIRVSIFKRMRRALSFWMRGMMGMPLRIIAKRIDNRYTEYLIIIEKREENELLVGAFVVPILDVK